MYYLYKLSKEIHLYSSLFLSLFILWMSASGILLNHPGLISTLSLPLKVMPASYGFNKWNRYAFRDAVFINHLDAGDQADNHFNDVNTIKNAGTSLNKKELIFVCGKQGVWKSSNNGLSFQSANQGFPESAWLKDTLCLLSDKQENLLYAGTRQGLWVYDFTTDHWRKIEKLDGNKIVSLIQNKRKIYAFTPSHCFVKDISTADTFQKMVLRSGENRPATMSMTHFMLSLHDGSLLGLPGKLLADFMAAVMILLTLSGFYLWIVLKNKKQFKGKKRVFKLFLFCRRYHLKLGIWCAAFLIIIILAGTIIKPPFRQLIYKQIGSKISIPGMQADNPFKNQITRAVFLPDKNQVLLSTKQGFYIAHASLIRAFTKIKIPVKVSGMGVTVLKALPDNHLLVGSFAGCFLVDLDKMSTKNIFDTSMVDNSITDKGQISTANPMVSGILMKEDKLIGLVDYRRGFQAIDNAGKSGVFFGDMPEDLLNESSISLWHGLFELHNARIFQTLFKQKTWLIIPVCGIMSLIIILSGCFNWFYIKSYRQPRR